MKNSLIKRFFCIFSALVVLCAISRMAEKIGSEFFVKFSLQIGNMLAQNKEYIQGFFSCIILLLIALFFTSLSDEFLTSTRNLKLLIQKLLKRKKQKKKKKKSFNNQHKKHH